MTDQNFTDDFDITSKPEFKSKKLNRKMTYDERLKQIHEWVILQPVTQTIAMRILILEMELETLKNDLNQIDHADYCMCRMCVLILGNDTQANSNTDFQTDINKQK